MMDDFVVDLQRLGDELQQATKLDFRNRRGASRSRATRRPLAIAAVGLALLAVAGGSVAATLWPTPTPSAESSGLVAADAVFAGANPSCAPAAGASTFVCSLEAAPTGLVVVGSYVGTKVATVDASKRVNGGCVSTTADGRQWDCYVGQAAVEHNIIDQAVLGSLRTSVAHG